LMEHFHNNLMKLGGPLGNVPKKIMALYKNRRFTRLSITKKKHN
jgi:hypothetical protein